MGVNLGGTDIFVAEQLLHGPDVVARFEQVGGKAVAKSMARGMLCDAGLCNSGFDGTLKAGGMDMVPPNDITARVFGQISSRKEPLPTKFLTLARLLAGQGVGHFDFWRIDGAIFGVKHFYVFELKL